MIEAVLFDLDGTLVHSAPGILGSFVQTFAAAGIRAVEPVDERVIGPPLVATLRRLTGIDDEQRIGELARAFKAIYDAHGVIEAEPYPGLDDVLSALDGAGRRSFIVTNKRKLPARLIAERLGIMPRFVGLYSLDTLAPPVSRKREVVARLIAEHGIDAGAAALVGDSVEDAEAAASNDMRFVAATYGYGAPLAFTEAAPAATLDRLADLPGVLSRLD